MEPLALLFFAAFALVLVMMYLGLRRGWAAPGRIAAAGVFASATTMTLSMMARSSVAPLQGIIFGTAIGVLFALAVMVIAWYFQRGERPMPPPTEG